MTQQNSSVYTTPKPPPSLDIPPSSSTVTVRVIDTKTILHLRPAAFWWPSIEGYNKFNAPVYCFLISHGNHHVIFDLGVRYDWENYSPANVAFFTKSTLITTGKNVASILDSDQSNLNIRSKDIASVIWSHYHFEHTGDMSTFPPSTSLIIGPGLRDTCWPGYPTRQNGLLLDSDIKGRQVLEVSFSEGEPNTLQVGGFNAVDFFGDGSFYILDTPGHCQGHISGLARVTPDTFVFMGGDACHHPGLLRPTEYLPLPLNLTSSTNPSRPISEKLIDAHRRKRGDQPFFLPSLDMFPDQANALETIKKIQVLEATGSVLVVLSHDPSLQGQLKFFPDCIDNWKEEELHSKVRWLFCAELADGLFQSDKYN